MAKKKYSKKYNNTVNIFWTGGSLDIPSVKDLLQEDVKQMPIGGMQKNVNKIVGYQAPKGNNWASVVSNASDLFSGIASMIEGKSTTPITEKIGLPENAYAAGGAIGIANSAIKGVQDFLTNSQLSVDPKGIKSDVTKYGQLDLGNITNYDDLLTKQSVESPLKTIRAKDLKRGNFGSDFLKSVGAAGEGFMEGGMWGAILRGVGSLGGSIVGRLKANKEKRRINEGINIANLSRSNTFMNKFNNIYGDSVYDRAALFAANGGPLNMRYTGVMSPFGNRFDLGGNMDTTFTNGITIVGNGGTHEESPLEGVPMGIAPDGKPNLVEEGEVIWNDYVFSDRLKVPKAIRKQYKLRGNKELTFADAAKQMQEESKERPNDPISKRGLQDSMMKLMSIQEIIRQEKEGNQFSVGGHLFDTGSKLNTYSNFTALPQDTDFYDKDYLAFWDWMNANRTDQKAVDWLNRINAGDFGTVGGNTFTFDDILRLAKDYKKGPVHNAFYEASRAFAKEDPIIERTSAVNLGIVPFKDEVVQQKAEKASDVVSPYTPTYSAPLLENPHWLRYASVLGPGIGLLQNLLSKPNYSRADEIISASRNIDPVKFNPLGDYWQYTPFDRNYYINKALADNAATRRSFENLSGGNRALAAAGILGADYNTIEGLGKLARQAEEYNLEQRKAVKEFNRGTNQFNAQGKFEADRANQQMRLAGLDALIKANAMKEDIDARRSASISTNLGKLFDNLGAVGTDITNRRDRNMLIENEALYAPFVKYIDEKLAEKDSKKEQSVTRAKGGKLNKKYKKK